jgi:hypothetical protein
MNQQLLQDLDLTPDDPNFYDSVFSKLAKIKKKTLLGKREQHHQICVEEYDRLSHHLEMSELQDAASVRNVLRTRRIATLVVNEKGDIDFLVLDKIIECLSKHLYTLGPRRQYDASRQEHILRVLNTLKREKRIQQLLLSITRPEGHKYADRVLRETLALSSKIPLNEAHARRAALSALLCYLRQSVGSCFGTAPSIIIQQEQYALFLKDIAELLNTGRIKRVSDGVEYSVPFSQSWGAGELKRPFVIPTTAIEEGPKFWYSPGLITALKEIGVLQEEQPLGERIETLKKGVIKALSRIESQGNYLVVTCEDLLRMLIEDAYGVTQKEVETYQSTLKSTPVTPLLRVDTKVKGAQKKAKGPAQFIAAYEEAKVIFLSLADNALLKSWEFTIASFAETQSTFTSWNLYSSLGMQPEQPGGIGATLYTTVKHQLDATNAEVERLQAEYETAFLLLKGSESKMRNVSSEKESSWVRSEYQSRRSEFNALEERRNIVHYKAKKIASLYQYLIDRYYELFPKFFQEIYDPDMHIAAGRYDDSPAGFRLIYKYGRTNTAAWTLVRNANEYIEALAAFFVATEVQILTDENLKGLNKELNEIVSAVVNQIRTEEFLVTSFNRMAIAHNKMPIKDPLNNLDKIDKKPWAYTSGGNSESLIATYFSSGKKPTVVERWFENDMELFVYIVDIMKQIPPKEMDAYLKVPNKSFLMHSPTHVFTLKPQYHHFNQTFKNNAYTYIYLRDYYVNPTVQMTQNMVLDQPMMSFLSQRFAEKVHPDLKPTVLHNLRYFSKTMRPSEFRDYVESQLPNNRMAPIQYLDSILFETLPLFYSHDLFSKAKRILSEVNTLSDSEKTKAFEIMDKHLKLPQYGKVMGANELNNFCKALILLVKGETSMPENYHQIIQDASSKIGFSLPQPVIFADTNWTKWLFGFVVNPGTEQLEFWLVDPIGSEGQQMVEWRQWLDGSDRKRLWGVYIKPFEYSSPYL